MANKFKSGDKVRIVKRNPKNDSGIDNNGKKNVGLVGYIQDVSGPPFPYAVHSNPEGVIDYYGWFGDDELELVERNSSYKVGDRVRIVKRKDGNTTGVYQDTKKNVGSVGVVAEIWSGRVNVWGTKDKDAPYYGIFEEDDVELVEENNYDLLNNAMDEISGTLRIDNSYNINNHISLGGYVHITGDLLVDGEIKQTKKTLMKTVSNFMKKFLDPGAQSLVKAGFINGDLELTLEGKEALFSVLFDANKEALVKLAKDKILEEEEK